MAGALTIGEFARLSHLSVRTLRRYHDGGLLEPARVDPATGYRYYTSEQIPAAQVIHRLRELDMPLAEVRDLLATDDPGSRAAMLASHLARMERELDRTRAAVSSLRRLLQPEPAPLDVRLRSVPAQVVMAVQDTVALDDVLEWYGDAMVELDAALAGAVDAGPPGGVYANELFTEGSGHVLVYRQVNNLPARGRVEPIVLPAVELAVATHAGDHDDIDVTYGSLGAYVTDHQLVVAGPVREVYVVGPRDAAAPELWRTEIGWPVFRLAADDGSTAGV